MAAQPADRQFAGTLTPDADLRQRLFGAETMRHPAKQSLPQLYHLLRRFAVPGGIMLDPFGGSGSAQIAAGNPFGMYVITVELATHFHAMQQRAWEHFRCSIDMQDCYDIPPGDYWPMLGDSRNLMATFAANGVELPCADLIVTSPSYGGSEAVDQRKKQNATIAAHGGGNAAKSGYQQIPRMRDNQRHGFGKHSQLSAVQHGYVDTIITSPPYQDAFSDKNKEARTRDRRAKGLPVGKGITKNSNSALTPVYDIAPENIGNLRGGQYLASMAHVWAGCAAVLKPGGILCCITRDCVRDGKIVPVGQQNRDLLTAAGLELIDIERWHVDRLSFWRILQKRKNPDAPIIDTEEVSVFRRPMADALESEAA
jgi:DNA modification methylase